jgi:hypothetical protein
MPEITSFNYAYDSLTKTYSARVNADTKDIIQIEIGDNKQSVFYPQYKFMRWDNEVNFSVRLVNDEVAPTQSLADNVISWDGVKIGSDLYEVVDGYEFEVILKEPPKSNVVQFTLVDKNVAYYYQPELTQDEIDRGVIRPDNVVGSYAVYATIDTTNYRDGKLYRCGKVGHIYRPKIIDSKGIETWGELNISGGILSVTIPQKFLDTAVYPIRHAAGLTIGNITQGASNGAWGSGSNYQGVLATSPSGSNNVVSCSTYGSDSSTGKFKSHVALNSDGSQIAVGPANATYGTSGGWVTDTFSAAQAISASTQYLVGGVPQNLGAYYYYDVFAGTTKYKAITYPTIPNPLTSLSSSTNLCSHYATLEASGGGASLPLKNVFGRPFSGVFR